MRRDDNGSHPGSDWLILRHLWVHELRRIIAAPRSWTAAILIAVMMTFSGVTFSARHLAEQAAEIPPHGSPSPYKDQIGLDAWLSVDKAGVKPPWMLAFLANGEQNRAPNIYLPSLSLQQNQEWVRNDQPSYRLQPAESMDWLFVVKVILSMAAFVVGYDAVCGRHQLAMLRMTLSYPVRRSQLILVKCLAVWVSLAAPFLIGAAVSLLILTSYGGMRFSLEELSKISGILILALWASAIFTLLAVLISILSRESTRSLAVLTLIWVTMIVVVPGAGGLIAQTAVALDSDHEIEDKIDTIRDQIQALHGTGSQRNLAIAREDDYEEERNRAEIQNEIYLRQESVLRKTAERRFSRAILARDLGMISPTLLIQDLAERFIGSGLARDRRFVEMAWAYGDDLAAWALSHDMKNGGPRVLRDIEPARLEDGRHIRFIPDFASRKPIDPAEAPQFLFLEQTSVEGLSSALPRFALLAVWTLVLAAAVIFFFDGFDVGGTR